MESWAALRKHSVGKANRSRRQKQQQQEARKSLRCRGLHIEQFEDRLLLSIGNWVAQGPGPIDYGQVTNVGPKDATGQYLNEVVGAVEAIAVHPTNPDVMYVGAVNGGVWRTDNATAAAPTWHPLTDAAASLSIGALAIDPTDATGQTVVAGIGRWSNYGREGGNLTGILRTTDGGTTWKQFDGGGTLIGKNISAIAARGSAILVSVDSADSGLLADTGIFRSIDGGVTFTRISRDNGAATGLPGGKAFDLAADPTNNNVFYTAIVGADTTGGQNGIYKSTNMGANWTKVSNAVTMDVLIQTDGFNATSNIRIAVGRANNVYVGIANSGQLAGVFRSGNGGQTWTAMDLPTTAEGTGKVLFGINPGSQAETNFSFCADPTDPNVVYIGGDRQPAPGRDGIEGTADDQFPNSIGASDYTGRLFRGDASKPANTPIENNNNKSSAQWVAITNNANAVTGAGTAHSSAPHADSRDMAIDALGRLIEVDDGGVYVRTSPRDNTGDWSSINNTLAITEFHDIAYDNISNIIIGGAQDTGVSEQVTPGGTVWREVQQADGGAVAVAVDDVSLAGLNESYRYSSYQNLGDFKRRIVDAQNNVVSTPDTESPALVVTGTGGQTIYAVDQLQFTTPVVLNAVDPSRLVIGGAGSVFESSDRGETVTNLNQVGMATAFAYGGYKGSAPNVNVLWAVSDNGVFVRTAAGGALNNTNFPGAAPRDIAIDSTDWSKAYVVTADRIYFTSDTGATWTDITGNYQGVAGLQAVEFAHSGKTGAILVAGLQGVYAAEAGDPMTWYKLGANLPNAPVYDLYYDAKDDILVAGTLGRGAWELPNTRTEIFGVPDIVSVSTNISTYQRTDNPTMSVAPQEFVLLFNDKQVIDSATLGGIQIVCAGPNGQFYDPVTNPNDIDDVVIAPGWVGIGDKPNEVIVRMAETLPSGLYRITFVGQGADGVHLFYGPDGKVVTPLTNTAGVAFEFGQITPAGQASYWDGKNFVWSFTLSKAPEVISVVPQPVIRNADNSLSQARNVIEVYFSDDMDAASAQTLTYYHLIATQDSGNVGDDVVINPTGAVYDAAARKVTLTFGTNTAGNAVTDLANLVADGTKKNAGAFRLRIGNEYRPIVTTERTDISDAANDVGSMFNNAAVLGKLSDTADPTGKAWVISGNIGPRPYDLEWPGAQDTPGDRSLPPSEVDRAIESHIADGPGDVGPEGEIPTYYYNFNDIYGTIQGQPAHNLITEVQKQRIREMFELFSKYWGVQFIETTADRGIQVVVGDSRAVVPNAPPALYGIATGDAIHGLSIMSPDGAESSASGWNSSNFGGDYFFQHMHETMHCLGFLHTYDQPPSEIMASGSDPNYVVGSSEMTFPGMADVVHGMFMYRKDSMDIDMYKFQLDREGTLNAETIARRMQDSSLLDSALVLYDANMNVIARNDNYFDKDSFINLHLAPGTYYIGVSAAGNAQYDPSIQDSGVGGTTQGDYELRLTFQPRDDVQLINAKGVALDGDADGNSGGTYNYWFNVQTASATAAQNHTIVVDKLSAGPTYDGTLAHPFKYVSDAMTAAAQTYNALTAAQLQQGANVIVRVVGNNFANDNQGHSIQAVSVIDPVTQKTNLTDGQTFTISDAKRTVTFELDSNNNVTSGNIAVRFGASDNAATIATKLAAAINSVSWTPLDSNGNLVSNARQLGGLYVGAVAANDIVKLVGPVLTIDLGISKLKLTVQDNKAYEIGTDPLGNSLSDGRKLEVPKGVTLMIDAGAVFKLRGANIDVGSSAQNIDRSLGAVQVLGTPTTSVYFTSYMDERIGVDTYANSTTPASGDWGGLVFRNNFDYDEQTADPTRKVLEQQGIFLDYVNHADIRFGGGKVTVNGVSEVYDPIHMVEARPTISYNRISSSADATLSADPNSLLETEFRDRFGETLYTADYNRVGPEIHGNTLLKSSINGLFLRVHTSAGQPTQQLDVSGRFDDLDTVLAIPENVIIRGNPGQGLDVVGTSPLTAASHNEIVCPAGSEFVDRDSFVLSDTYKTVRFEFDLLGDGVTNGTPAIPNVGVMLTSTSTSADVATAIAARINFAAATYGLKITAVAVGSNVVLSGSSVVVQGLTGVQARLSGRLDIDPGAVVKLGGTRIETGFAAQLIAEGTPNYPVIFTSLQDDTYGAGGTYDTTNNAQSQVAAAGNWGGLYFNPTSSGSIDNARILYGGGNVAIEGGFANFDPVEIRQATVRVTDTLFQHNASGTSGDRNGRGSLSRPATIYVWDAQPILVNNIIRDNQGAAICIDVTSLTADVVADWGRSTGTIQSYDQYADNHGAMVRGNRLTNNSINGMVVRGGGLTTEGIWDDTDIAHVVFDAIEVPNFHVYGGLRLQSSSTDSLVVKLSGANAGFTSGGRPMDYEDRVGGTLQILGMPGHPVVLTSLADDTVSAGFDPNDRPLFDTDNVANSKGAAGDWRGITIDRYSNDRNAAVVNEAEPAFGNTTDPNGNTALAQYLGQLAKEDKGGDDVLRLGFEVHGVIAIDRPQDADVYSFQGYAGSEIYIAFDRTSYSLDTVVELIDADGTVLAKSDNWRDETAADPANRGIALPMSRDGWGYKDSYSFNPRDAGMRLVLPGPANEQRMYYVRVSSAAPAFQGAQQTKGEYQMQIRLGSVYEHPGSTVRYADIRYATNGIQVLGEPGHSPLTVDAFDTDAVGNAVPTANNAFNVAQDVGNLVHSDQNMISVAGVMSSYTDVSWYKFTVDYGNSVQHIAGVSSAGSRFPVIIDVDYTDGMRRPDAAIYVYDSAGNLILASNDSNVADDRANPLNGADMADLTRGSVGTHDAYIGPVYLPEGTNGTFYIAVASQGAHPNAAANTLVRWEPIDSLQRVAEDNIGSINGSIIANAPASTLFPGTMPVQLNLAADPFNLGDVPLYVLSDSDLMTVDPYTGAAETDVTSPGATNVLPDVIGASLAYGDLVMRNDGRLYTYTRGSTLPGTDKNYWAGRFRELNTGDARNLVSDVSDGLVTYHYDATPPALDVAGDDNNEAGGVHIEAVAYEAGNRARRLFAIGNADNGYNEVRYQDNLLYLMNENGQAINPPGIPNNDDARMPTKILPLAQLQTSPFLNTVNATDVQAPANDILDGTRLVVTDDGGRTVTFEFDSGPDVDMGGGAADVRDGMTFTIGNGAGATTFEFDSGPVMVFGPDTPATPLDGTTFIVWDDQGNSKTFEFDNNGAVNNAAATAVHINIGDNTDAVAKAAVAAINAANISVKAVLGSVGAATARVSLTGDNLNVLPSGTGVTVEGRYGTANPGAGNILIPYKETSTDAAFGAQIQQIVQANVRAGIVVSFSDRAGSNDRLTFNNATVANFAGMNGVWTQRNGVAHGGPAPLSAAGLQDPAAPNQEVILFSATDSATEIARKIGVAVNLAAAQLGFTGTVKVNGGSLQLTNLSGVTPPTADAPLVLGGEGPGGKITGMAFRDGRLFCVTDTGGFYEILDYDQPNFMTLPNISNPDDKHEPNEIQPIPNPNGARLQFIGMVDDDQGDAVQFGGLTLGPQNVENAAYADTFFGVSRGGDLYALRTVVDPVFDTITVSKAPIFHDGATSVNVGVADVSGLAFTNIDYNLWHVTNLRGTDAGHGVNITYDSSRTTPPLGNFPVAGGQSFYFGLENPTVPTTISDQPGADDYLFTNNGVYNTYNIPDGPAGSLTTQPFSLEGYSADDLPTLYFNYFLQKGGPANFDTARVFASTDNTTWALIGELGNSNGWQQFNGSLGGLAGQKSIRLRFDFSCAGDMHVGENDLTGAYLQAISGDHLTDGQTFVVDNTTFEFDAGASLWLPNVSEATIPDGQTFTVTTDAGATTFEFDRNGAVGAGNVAIPIVADDTTAIIAQHVADAINAENLVSVVGEAITAAVFEDRVMLSGATNVALPANSSLSDLYLRLPDGGGAGMTDGTTFTIATNVGDSTFTFAENGVAGQLVIPYTATDTMATIAASTAAAINAAALRSPAGVFITAAARDSGVTIYGARDVTVPAESILAVLRGGGGAAGFTTADGVDTPNTPVLIRGDWTPQQVSDAIAKALDQQFSSGVVITTPNGADLDANAADGTTFTIQDATRRTWTFELDSDGVLATAGAIGVTFTADDTADVVATSIMNAILGAVPALAIVPTTLPGGYVRLGNVAGPGGVGTVTGAAVFSPGTSAITAEPYTASKLGNNGQIHLVGHAATAVEGMAGPLTYATELPNDHEPPPPPDRYLSNARGQDNAHEGFYIDDIIIGFAERGQMITNSPANTTFSFDASAPQGIINQGNYQLQIRRASDYGSWPAPAVGPTYPAAGPLALLRAMDTNDRLTDTYTISIPNAIDIVHGSTFTVSDGVNSVTFQFLGDGVFGGDPNNVAVYFSGNESGAEVAARVVKAINDAQAKGLFKVTATAIETSNRVDLFGAAQVDDMPADIVMTAPEGRNIVQNSTFNISGPADTQTEAGQSQMGSAQTAVFQFVLDPADVAAGLQAVVYTPTMTAADVAAAIIAAIEDAGIGVTAEAGAAGNLVVLTDASKVVNLTTNDAAIQFTGKGDANHILDQGQVILEGNKITYSSQYGIVVGPGSRAGDNLPEPRPVAPLRELNTQRQIPGVTVTDNVLAFGGKGGIDVNGDVTPNGQSIGSVYFSRIVNNTIFGQVDAQNGGIGIDVGPNASPTILNNVIANLKTGIRVDGSSGTTVVGTTAYANNGTNLTGVGDTFPMYLLSTDPLFVDAANGNFYPAHSSPIIDSSMDALGDRLNMIQVRAPLGLAESPILAPDRDLFGQLRMDDPSVAPPLGFGNNAFKDRGAVDRVDFEGPTAALVDPLDNDSLGQDRNPATNDVSIALTGSKEITQFVIQLNDPGAGVADSTVTSDTVTVYRDGVLLADGPDYFFIYDSTNHKITLTSAAGVWAPESTYTIVLNETVVDGGIRDQAGNSIQPNRTDGTTKFNIVVSGFDFGDAPMYTDAGHTISATALPDGARHLVTPGVYLGNSVDREPDARINANATGDPDDDGVVFSGGATLISSPAGETAALKSIVVTASTAGVLDAWIDWNNDRVWEAGEKAAFTDAAGNPITAIHAGANTLYFAVPTGMADNGAFQSFARFRFSTTGLLSNGDPMQPTGEASDGEVEDYQITVIPFFADWGDAPDPTYPTLQASNGAYHRIVYSASDPITHEPVGIPTLSLGAAVLPELDGQPSLTASLSTDDDGVDFSNVFLVQGRNSNVPVMVTNTTGQQAYLNAWIDFNGDGVWSDVEKVASAVPVQVGANILTVAVPANAAVKSTFARFRLSTTPSLPTAGGANNGEVEDYQVAIHMAPGTISGRVWNDLNGNGSRDGGEPGLPNWTVYLDDNGNGALDAGEMSAASAADGAYEFPNADPGIRTVREVQPSTGWNITTPVGGSYTVNLASGQTVLNNNFGNHDIAPPVVTVNPLATNDSTPTLTGTVTEPAVGSGIASVKVLVGGQTLTATVTGTTWSVTVPVALADGTYAVTATAKDTGGNSADDPTTNELVIDTGVPIVTVSALTTNNNMPTLTGTVTDPAPSSGIASVTVSVGGQTLAATVTGAVWSVDVPVALADGTYDVSVTAVDNAGNSGSDATINELVIDTVKPTVTVNRLITSNTKPTLTGTVGDALPSSGVASVTVVVGTQTLNAIVTGTTWSVDVPVALADGTYNVTATARDAAGNAISDATIGELTVDTVRPIVTVNSVITANNKPTLSGTISDPTPGSGITSLTVVVGTQTLTAFVNGTNWNVAVPVALADGKYDVVATAVDFAGNTASDSTTGELTVDTVKPEVTVNTLLTNSTKPTLTGTVIDPIPGSGVVSVLVSVGSQTLAATISGTTWSVALTKTLADGTYDVKVTATDAAGNVGNDATNNELTIDTVHPTNIILSNSTVPEHRPVDTLVGLLTSQGPHSGAFAYALVPGDGINDNSSFRIVNDQLQTSAVFDFATKSSYSVRIRTTDSLGYTFEKVFTISVVSAVNTVAIGDRVWNDVSKNGLQDAGETGIAGVAVELFISPSGVIGSASDVTCGQTVTDANGNYSFPLLLSGFNYYLVFRAPSGYVFTTPNVAGDTINSDANAAGVTGVFTLTAGANDSTRDAGLVYVGPTFPAAGFAARAGSINDDYGQSVAVDAAGNVYVTGAFRDTVDFDPGPGVSNLTSAGGTDIFVAKYSPTGTLVWARSMGGTGDDIGNGIAIGPDGVYLTGAFSGVADFDPSLGKTQFTSAGDKDVFVAKVDAFGNLLWARAMGGTGEDIANGIAVAADGSAYTTGSFQSTADFDPGAAVSNLTSVGPKDVFVSKLDKSGNFVWANRMGGIGWSQGLSIGRGIALGPDGSVLTTGSFQGIADFDPGTSEYRLTCAGDSDVFVSKSSSAGAFVWARGMGGTGEEYGAGIVAAADGSVYTTGGFQGLADFDPGTAVYNLDSAGYRRTFVSKLDSAGNFVWARGAGGTGSDRATGIALGADGSVYATGGFQGNADFDPGPGVFMLTSAGATDVVVQKLDATGRFLWAGRMGGTLDDCATGIAVGANGAIYTTGYFQGTVAFDTSPTGFKLTSAGGQDMFVSRLFSASVLTVAVNQAPTQSDPTSDSAIHFRVVFNSPVTTFGPGNVVLGGNVPGTLAVAVSPVGTDGMTYDVAVSGMAGNGTLTASIPAGVVQDASGNPNLASASSDNSVTYALPQTSFALTGPTSGTYTAGQVVPIQWNAANVAAGSKISLAYDEDTTWWNGNEHWIEIDQVAGANGASTYNWNTTGVKAGTYYVAGYLWQNGAVFQSHLTQSIIVQAVSTATTFALTSPTSGTFTAGQVVPIQWNAANVAAGSKISLAYDEDTTWWNGNEHWIEIDQVAGANGAGTYNWSTTGVKAGTYYMAGYLWQNGAVIQSHLTQSIVVQAAGATSFTLTGPTSGTYTAGQTVSIAWTAGNVVAGSKISLAYDEDTTWWNGNEHWIEIDQVAGANGASTYNWNTTGVKAGTYYIAGYLWQNGAVFQSHLTQSITVQTTGATSFAVTAPTSGTFTAGQVVPIQWNAANVAAGSKISLAYDEDTTWWNGNEHWIEIDQVAGANGVNTYNWDTTGVKSGTYYIAGYLWQNGAVFQSHLTQSMNVAAPLTLAAAQPAANSNAGTLLDSEMTQIVNEAIRRLVRQNGTAAAALSDVSVQIADLPGLLLGETIGNKILIDRDAAGYGWFVDQTPGDDVEFADIIGPHTLAAQKGSAAAQHADLLTTVMHEMGHVLGRNDSGLADDLMGATLPLGERRLLGDVSVAKAAVTANVADTSILDHVFASLDNQGKKKWSWT